MERYMEQEFFRIDQMQDGYSFENYIATLLRGNGYQNISVTEKSGDYGADVIAFLKNDKIAFQCKLSASDIGIKAVQEAISGKLYYKCAKAVVVTNRYFTNSAITLAAIAHVDLWNRKKLSTYLIPSTKQTANSTISDANKLFMSAVEYVLSKNVITTAELQIKFNIGYAKAAIFLEKMNGLGIVGPYTGTRPRQVLIDQSQFSFGVPEKNIEQQKAAQQNYDFRQIYWGMDKQQIICAEGSPDCALQSGAYLYENKTIAGRKCDLLICFNECGLAHTGIYSFTFSQDAKVCIAEYKRMKGIVSIKYGVPLQDRRDWGPKANLKAESLCEAVQNGNLEYMAYWQTLTTNITLLLYLNNGEITCDLDYTSSNDTMKPKVNLNGI
jgi:hypothetical protein